MINYLSDALQVLIEVYIDKKYVNVALTHIRTNPLTTKIVYGVIENEIQLEDIISQLVAKQPDKRIKIILKMGIYLLLHTDNIPQYAIVNESVNLTKKIGKQGLSGFVNSVLKKVSQKEYEVKNNIGISCSKPDWFITKLREEYDNETVEKIIKAKPEVREHIRVNLSNPVGIEEEFIKRKIEYEKTQVGGYYVKLDDYIKGLIHKGNCTIMSPSSMLTCQVFNIDKNKKLLDLCSAPGGKAIYLSELSGGTTDITACDIHFHRLNLIESYAKKMKTKNIMVKKNDAMQFNPEYENQFDYVLLDAPCSCMGTFLKHPDVFLNKELSDIKMLAKNQKKMVDNAVRYLKKGGYLVYSTCTIFKEENGEIADYISEYLKEDYSNCIIKERYMSLFDKYNEGFFISRFVK